MSQLSSCIALMKANGGKITCGRLSQFGLYHKAASRLGVEARNKGYVIEFTSGKTWDEGVYTLISEPWGDSISGNAPEGVILDNRRLHQKIGGSTPPSPKFHLEPSGQFTFLGAS